MTEDEEGQLIELSNLANQSARVENLLEESKAPRPPSPRVKHVAEQDRA
jgi:hypothetical protein